jgi:hypothetical protein
VEGLPRNIGLSLKCLLWKAFCSRGWGYLVQAPSSQGLTLSTKHKITKISDAIYPFENSRNFSISLVITSEASGLYYKTSMIVIYDHNDSSQYYKTVIMIVFTILAKAKADPNNIV